MTTANEPTTIRSYGQILTDAVAVLTEAARTIEDFAGFLSAACAGAAANLGSLDQLIAGRPGSWEAELVWQLLTGTVGDDDRDLLGHRTDPLVVRVYVDNLLTELGLDVLYDEAYDELDRRWWTNWPPEQDLDDLTAEQRAAMAAVEQQQHQLEQLRSSDWAAYGQAFAEAVRSAAREQMPELATTVRVVVELDAQPGNDSGNDLSDGPETQLWDAARAATPLPGSGIALRDYPPGADIARHVREAGRTPLARLDTTSEEAPS